MLPRAHSTLSALESLEVPISVSNGVPGNGRPRGPADGRAVHEPDVFTEHEPDREPDSEPIDEPKHGPERTAIGEPERKPECEPEREPDQRAKRQSVNIADTPHENTHRGNQPDVRTDRFTDEKPVSDAEQEPD